jgi:hypothetical protein
MTDKSDLTRQLAAVETAADDCLSIANCKTIPIQALGGRTLAATAADDADAKLSEDPVFAPVRRIRDWSRATARGISQPGATPDVQEFSRILRDLKAVSAVEPTGAFVELVAKAETLQTTLTDRRAGAP